jgi:ABC-type multidrug transport system ATPase subunit
VIAIMGSSGAGKTTLLNILAGRVATGHIEGDILVNEARRESNWKRVAGYVQQEDVMYHMLTVRETVAFAANMKLPRRMGRQEKDQRIDHTIRSLGLETVKHSRLGDALHRGISGGERKRVSIAFEVASDPRLLFLDEPTSGLDAFTAFYIVDNVKQLAVQEWRTMVMTIHQPRSNILGLFDKILLLSQGKVVFFGPPQDALEHFARCGYECPRHENPADFFIDVISIDNRTPEALVDSRARSDKLIAAWDAEHPPSSDDHNHSRNRNNNGSSHSRRKRQWTEWNNLWIREFCYLIQRDFQTQFRDYGTVIGLCVQTLIIGLLIAFIFFQMPLTFAGVQNRIGLLFFVPINQTFTIVMPLIPIFALDRAIILRERYSSMYRLSASFFSKFLSLIPLRVLLTTIFSFIVYYITGLRSGFQYFLIFWYCSVATG